MTPDRVIANLDAELHWARAAGCSVRDLPRHVMQRISAYGTLLRALWPGARRIWTPAPVSPACVREVDELQAIESYETGAGAAPEPAFAWADASPCPDAQRNEAAMRANDRRFAYETAADLGVTLPGTAWVTTAEEIAARGRAYPRWVLKAPFGSAGRGFVHGRRTAFDEPHAARLLASYGQLVFEPWLERRLDIGVVVQPDQAPRLHTIHSDTQGRFRGITVGGPDAEAFRPALCDIADGVSRRLARVGYEGPFGVDAFVDVDDRLVPLCEVNARHTFGHVAHALQERVGVPRWGPDVPMTLHLRDEPESRDDPRCISLLGSEDGARRYAWISVSTGLDSRA